MDYPAMPAQVNDKVSLHAHQQLGNTGGADPPARKSALMAGKIKEGRHVGRP